MRKVLLQTATIQGMGVMLMFAVTLLVARLGGPSEQGSFAFVKSTTDFLVSIFSLGLPPAIVYLLNRTGDGHNMIYRYSLSYGVVLTLSLPVLVWIVARQSGLPEDKISLVFRSVAIGCAGAWLTTFALLRGLILVHSDGPIFSLISILQWIVIAIVAVLLLNRNDFVFEAAYFMAGAISVAAALFYLKFLNGNAPAEYNLYSLRYRRSPSVNWSMLKNQSLHVLLQSSLLGAQPFVTNAALAHSDSKLELIGIFNVASFGMLIPNLLVSLVAPVLYNRWSKSLQWSSLNQVIYRSLLIACFVQISTLPLITYTEFFIQFTFGEDFVAASPAARIMLLAVFAVVAGRIITPALQGIGATQWVTYSCVVRIVAGIFVGSVGIICIGQSALVAIALAWCLAEYAALLTLLAKAQLR